jgi:hypothetical protein
MTFCHECEYQTTSVEQDGAKESVRTVVASATAGAGTGTGTSALLGCIFH